MTSILKVFCIALLASVVSKVQADEKRAHVNYMLHCQGCHLPQAEGFSGRVPPMKDFVGYFLHSKEGREFLIRVPGVAHSALGDAEVTELMNWLLMNFSKAELPEHFKPFSIEEVSALRQNPELMPDQRRQEILTKIASSHPTLTLQQVNNSGS